MHNNSKGTSYVPMVLGIVATVFNLPAILCTTLCGAIFSAIGEALEFDSATGSSLMALGLLSFISGILGSFSAKNTPITGGVELLIAAILSIFIFFISFNFLQFFVTILYTVASIISFTQKREGEYNYPVNKKSENIDVQINIHNSNYKERLNSSKSKSKHDNPNDYFNSRKGNVEGNPYV
jgi:predicted membrane protein